jgi:hypothetical protein
MATGLIILVGIMAKCCIDFIGLEYSPKHQCLTDSQFYGILAVCIVLAFMYDVLHLVAKFRGRKCR